MLPDVDALFTLVRQLATRSPVTDVAAPKWLVQRHGLGAMAARAGVRSYRDDLVRATLQWVRIEDALPAIVDGLRAAGARVAPIKGVAYAKALHAAPCERPMNDIDLLVPPADVAAGESALAALGFERGKSAVMHHARPWVRGNLVIDLHKSIIAPGRSRIDLEAVWSRTKAGWPAGAEFLDPVDALVFHLVHLARNRLLLPLVNVVDAARLLEQADAARALKRAHEWGLGTAAGLALDLCAAILEDHAGRPAGWLGPSRADVARIEQPGFARKAIFDLVLAGSPRQLAARVVGYGANLLNSRSRR